MSAEAQAAEVAITLPDGSERRYAAPTTGLEIAASIGPGLAKAALAIRVDGKLVDLKSEISSDADVAIVTAKDADGLELIRHDAAHVLAEAAKELYPDCQVTIGPVIEDGFYYDFARETPFTPEDLEAMEKRMAEIIGRDEAIEREVWDRDKAIAFFESIGEAYKAESSATCPQTKSSRSIARAILSICAEDLICPRPASCPRRSS